MGTRVASWDSVKIVTNLNLTIELVLHQLHTQNISKQEKNLVKPLNWLHVGTRTVNLKEREISTTVQYFE